MFKVINTNAMIISGMKLFYNLNFFIVKSIQKMHSSVVMQVTGPIIFRVNAISQSVKINLKFYAGP